MKAARKKFTINRVLVSAFICCSVLVLGHGQSKSELELLFRDANKSSLQKVLKDQETAEKAMQESNDLYSELEATENNYDIDQKTLEKEVARLSEAGAKKRLESFESYRSMNKGIIDQFRGLAESNENIQSVFDDNLNLAGDAADAYKKADKTKREGEKLDIMAKAHEDEMKLTEKLFGALLGIPAETEIAQTEEAPTETSFTEIEPEPEPQAAAAVAAPVAFTEIQEEEPAPEPVVTETSSFQEIEEEPIAQPEVYAPVEEAVAAEPEPVYVPAASSIPGEVVFRVQVAAARQQMNDQELARIYNKGGNVVEIVEDDWYKYQIEAGDNFQQALDIMRNSGVEKAFMVAYKGDVKISVAEARKALR